MIATFFVINSMFAAIETLQNPILADNFGMSVKWGSYIFFISFFFFPVAVLAM